MTVMQREVLVLNKGWSAIGVVPLERAINMLFSTYKDGTPKARVIDPSRDFQQFTWADWSRLKPKDGEDCIRSAFTSFCVPEVILLSRYDKLPYQKANFSRRTLFRRDNYECQYCGCKPGTAELSLDHVVPRSQGGKTTWENVVCACVNCNSKKADRSLHESGLKFVHPGFKPCKPKTILHRRTGKVCKSWTALLGEAYWAVELQNDNS